MMQCCMMGAAAAPLHQRATATIRVAALDYRAGCNQTVASRPGIRCVSVGEVYGDIVVEG